MSARSSTQDGLAPRGRGGDIVFPELETYLETLETTRDAVLLEMERRAAAEDFPIVGPLVGRMLCLLAKSIGARRVLELGSGYGYSAYWFARSLPPDGEIVLTEMSETHLRQAEGYFRRGGLRCRARFEQGDGLQILDRLPGEFDIILNDVHKQQYPAAFQAVSRVRAGGYFLSDNMLWGGRVARDPSHATTRGVLELTRLLFAEPNLYTTILPLRDGLSVSLKVS